MPRPSGLWPPRAPPRCASPHRGCGSVRKAYSRFPLLLSPSAFHHLTAEVTVIQPGLRCCHCFLQGQKTIFLRCATNLFQLPLSMNKTRVSRASSKKRGHASLALESICSGRASRTMVQRPQRASQRRAHSSPSTLPFCHGMLRQIGPGCTPPPSFEVFC